MKLQTAAAKSNRISWSTINHRTMGVPAPGRVPGGAQEGGGDQRTKDLGESGGAGGFQPWLRLPWVRCAGGWW